MIWVLGCPVHQLVFPAHIISLGTFACSNNVSTVYGVNSLTKSLLACKVIAVGHAPTWEWHFELIYNIWTLKRARDCKEGGATSLMESNHFFVNAFRSINVAFAKLLILLARFILILVGIWSETWRCVFFKCQSIGLKKLFVGRAWAAFLSELSISYLWKRESFLISLPHASFRTWNDKHYVNSKVHVSTKLWMIIASDSSSSGSNGRKIVIPGNPKICRDWCRKLINTSLKSWRR